MKFRVTKSSDWDYVKQVDINTLEELITFLKENGSIIISQKYKDFISEFSNCDFEIEIYDYYRE